MNKDINKTILFLALISTVLCGCPGCFLLMPGINSFVDVMGNLQSFENLTSQFLSGFIHGGWMICPGSILILIPIILIAIAVIKGVNKDKLKELEPTGISKDEPIPPTS